MKLWQQRLLLAAGLAASVYGLVYLDVVSRAKHAYREGEKYARWSEHPQEREAYLNRLFAAQRRALDDQWSAGKLTPDQHAWDLELLEFSRRQMGQESMPKYAYRWYQTVVELFSPPESKWVRLARERIPQARERWVAELQAKGIPFDERSID